MNLFKIASRVAILFGGPQYKYFKDIVIEIDKNSLIGDPRFHLTGKWLGDPHPPDPMHHHFTEMDAEISFDGGDLVEGGNHCYGCSVRNYGMGATAVQSF